MVSLSVKGKNNTGTKQWTINFTTDADEQVKEFMFGTYTVVIAVTTRASAASPITHTHTNTDIWFFRVLSKFFYWWKPQTHMNQMSPKPI